MSIVVEVKEAVGRDRPINSRDGKSYMFREQEGFIALNGELRKISIPLSREQEPWPVGKYAVDDRSYQVSRFGKLLLNEYELHLRSLVPPAAKQG